MKRLITLCVVLTAIALAAAPVFAEVQNVKVSGDIKTTGVYRDNYTLVAPDRIKDDTNTVHDNRIVTQARVRVDADLTDNVSATIRYLTEYYWDTQDNTTSTGDDVDLDLANVTLKEAFYGPLTVTIGRQPLRYGNAFIIGDPDTNTTSVEQAVDGDLGYGDISLRKSFDALRAILDYSPLTVDLIYAKIDEIGLPKQDMDLYGANAAYDFENYDAEAEAYIFWLDGDTNAAPAPATQGIRNDFYPGSSVYTVGARGSLTPMDNLNVLGEFAVQKGDYDTVSATKQDQDAYAFQIAGDYSLQMEWEPVVRVGYTHYSGESREDDGDHEGWLPLFEDQTHGVVANYILGGVNGGQNSNADILNIGATAEPIEDMAVSIDFYNFWLDKKLVATDNNQASTHSGLGWYNLTEATYYMNTSDELGYEVDIALNYDYTEDVKMGLSAGWFVPGKAFEGANGTNENSETASQVLATIDVAF